MRLCQNWETQKTCSDIILMRDKETGKVTIFQKSDQLKEIFQCNTHFNACLNENLTTEPKQRMTKANTIYDKIQSFLLKDETELWTSLIHTELRIRIAGGHQKQQLNTSAIPPDCSDKMPEDILNGFVSSPLIFQRCSPEWPW